jgi:hypothetical protein
MAWATPYISKLKLGETVSFRPRGNSMQGKIESGQLCTVEPINDYGTFRKRRHCFVQSKQQRVSAFDKGDSG